MQVQNERGFALAVAIFALVVVGALVAGAFFIGLQEQRMGRNSIGNQQAYQAAELGIETELAAWDAVTYNALAIGQSDTSTITPASNGWYRIKVRRLSKYIFFLESEGFSADSNSRSHLGMITRLRPLEIVFGSALSTQGETVLSGNATITGANADPAGWTGCPAAPDDTLPGIATNDTSAIKLGKGVPPIEGDPGAEEDPTISDSSLTNFGDYDFDDLRDIASVLFSGNQNMANGIYPRASGGTCTVSNNQNWGEPDATVPECQGYFPVIYIDGDLTVNGLRGQGVLIVNGDMNIQGAFHFAGPVIIRQELSFQGAPSQYPRLDGGVIAANITTGKNAFAGNATIGYSFCAIDRALRNGALSKPLRERSWVNLF